MGLAALHFAAKTGRTSVKWLLERGADAAMGMGVLLLTLRGLSGISRWRGFEGHYDMRKRGSRYGAYSLEMC